MSYKHATKPEDIDRDSYYKVYDDYAKNLRNWFVAYGIGGPVLFLTQESITEKIVQSGYARYIVYAFLFGVAFQILLSLINKYNNYTIYSLSESEELMKTKKFKRAECISNQFWIDKLLDLLTVVAFGYATVRVLLLYI